MAPVSQAANGICYSVMGEITTAVADLERMVNAVPRTWPRRSTVRPITSYRSR